MDSASTSTVGLAQQEDGTAYQAFHSYQWDLDKDFLGGLVLALGGYHALAQTASQADIIMHSRLFYYARVRGVTISYAGYRQWLRGQYLSNPDATRIWEWHLLRAICNHRDRLVAASSDSTAPASTSSTGEQEDWMRNLLQTGPSAAAADVTAPAWMTAAPRGDLYVDKTNTANTTTTTSSSTGGDQVPYPEQFAAIVKAVQSGKPIEGIVEIPDMVARNPTTTPFGRMTRPVKPWEKTRVAQCEQATDEAGFLEQNIDSSFPEQEANLEGSKT